MTRPDPVFMLFWACILSAVYRPFGVDFQQGGLQGVLAGGLGANYIVWFSLLVAYLVASKEKSSLPLWLMGIVLVLMILPVATLSWFGAGIIAMWLWMKRPKDLALILLLAASLREPFTAICLKLFAGNILGFDAVLTNIALLVMGYEPVISSNIIMSETGQPLLILTGCSVFANLSFISLLWLALHVFFQQNIDRSSWILLGAMVIVTLAFNALRLALMTRSEISYYYYHDGMGSQLFEWGLIITVLVLLTGGCRYAKAS